MIDQFISVILQLAFQVPDTSSDYKQPYQGARNRPDNRDYCGPNLPVLLPIHRIRRCHLS
jgi:hypothetical protein